MLQTRTRITQKAQKQKKANIKPRTSSECQGNCFLGMYHLLGTTKLEREKGFGANCVNCMRKKGRRRRTHFVSPEKRLEKSGAVFSKG
jgi:hypothetical protein